MHGLQLCALFPAYVRHDGGDGDSVRCGGGVLPCRALDSRSRREL